MGNILLTFITSSIFATIAGVAINIFLERQKTKQSNKLEALTIAVALEGYSIACADKIDNHNTAMSSEGYAGSLLASVPDLPRFSVVAGFIQPRKAEIANRIMIFPQELRQADQLVAFWWDVVGDREAMHQAAKGQAAKMGLLSLDLARDIRSVFKLPARKLIFGEFNVRQILIDNQNKQ